jgi:hypothetical protein
MKKKVNNKTTKPVKDISTRKKEERKDPSADRTSSSRGTRLTEQRESLKNSK